MRGMGLPITLSLAFQLVAFLLLHTLVFDRELPVHVLPSILLFTLAINMAVLRLRVRAQVPVLSVAAFVAFSNEIGVPHPSHVFAELFLVFSALFVGIVATRWVGRGETPLGQEKDAQWMWLSGRERTYWDRANLTRAGLYLTTTELEFVEAAFSGVKSSMVADIAAGSGKLYSVLSRHSALVIATEADPSCLVSLRQLAQRVRNLSVLAVRADCPLLPLETASVDRVFCCETPRVSEQDWFFAECHRVLRPGGSVVVTATNRSSYKGVLARLRAPLMKEKWARDYYRNSFASLKHRWEKAGFFLQRSKGFFWAPVSRDSDSPVVSLFMSLEAVTGLHRLVRWSPMVLLQVRKGEPREASPREDLQT